MHAQLLQTDPAIELSEADNRYAANYLARTRDQLIETVSGLTARQWHFRPAPGKWSIALVLEHLACAETLFLTRAVLRITTSPEASPSPDPMAMDRLILRTEPDPSVEIAVEGRAPINEAPPFVQPSGDAVPADSLATFVSRRDETLAFLSSPPVELRRHATEHLGFGMLDGYQWLLFMASHTERHLAQICGIKTHPNFPSRN